MRNIRCAFDIAQFIFSPMDTFLFQVLLPLLFTLAVQEEKILLIHRSAEEQLIHLDIILTLRKEMIYVATACLMNWGSE